MRHRFEIKLGKALGASEMTSSQDWVELPIVTKFWYTYKCDQPLGQAKWLLVKVIVRYRVVLNEEWSDNLQLT